MKISDNLQVLVIRKNLFMLRELLDMYCFYNNAWQNNFGCDWKFTNVFNDLKLNSYTEKLSPLTFTVEVKRIISILNRDALYKVQMWYQVTVDKLFYIYVPQYLHRILKISTIKQRYKFKKHALTSVTITKLATFLLTTEVIVFESSSFINKCDTRNVNHPNSLSNYSRVLVNVFIN